jgi:hypothetical protein
MYYFGSARNQSQGQIIESYQVESGLIMVWVFESLQRDSFQVAISQSADNGSSFQEVGRIWAKRRTFAVEP